MNNDNFNSKRRKFNQIVFVSFLSITFLHFSKKENIIINQKKIRKNSKLKWILNSEDI
tara:strand:+ start:1381 stop:1554 length:174 start_codon:yes stop_codon:yes gene_type:complete